jgi:acetyltransferase-like isoleucine patch superfamily enzyme
MGKNVFIAPKVAFVPSNNHTPGKPSVMVPDKYRLEIGDDVWIGYGAILLMNLKIGKGATIGAGAVVTHDVKPGDIVAGVPARSIKKAKR